MKKLVTLKGDNSEKTIILTDNEWDELQERNAIKKRHARVWSISEADKNFIKEVSNLQDTKVRLKKLEKMFFWLGISLVLLSVIFLVYVASAFSEEIACFGDSVTKGYKVSEADTFCYQLGQRKGFHTTNFGMSQNTTFDGLSRINSVISSHPKIALIMFGLNDSYIDPGSVSPRVSLKDYRLNLVKMIKTFKENSIEPYLQTSNATSDFTYNTGLKSYVLIVRALSKKYKVPLIDNYQIFAEGVIEGEDLYKDFMHPNALGHTLILENILSKIT